MLERTASFSRDGRYRYSLARRWGDGEYVLPWVLLNPSTADGDVDDPTIRRVIGLSRVWGFDACVVVNLFAWRSPHPDALRDAADPVGPRNRRAVAHALAAAAGPHGRGPLVAVAWGAWRGGGVPVREASGAVLRRIAVAGLRPIVCGVNRDGSPRHPLYVPAAIRYSYLEHPRVQSDG